MLAAHHLTKSFGQHQILNDVSLAVHPGKITALIGPSGSGKTSLVRMLALLDAPDTGRIELDGERYSVSSVQKTHGNKPWPKVTVVFQQLFLWPHLSLRKNITLPLERVGRAGYAEQMAEMTERFQMTPYLDRFPNQVSGGERQRAALVRALMLKPSYLLLDEITSALDVEQVGIILSQLQSLRDHGLGILIVTHSLGFARRAGNFIAFLDRGKILEAGGREILDDPQDQRLKQFLAAATAAT